MTGTQTITAHVITTAPANDVTLDVKQARLTLDDSWSPYGQVTLVCWRPPEAVLSLIDPRTVPTPRVNVTLADGTTTRVLQLVLRSRTVDHVAGTVSVVAETDEALLIDKVRVATTVDTTAHAYQASLRTLINTVVLAPIGASLATDAGADADLSTYANQTNQITQPSMEVSVSQWAAWQCSMARVAGSAMPAGAGSWVLRTSGATNSFCYARIVFDVVAGQTYVASCYGRATTPGTGTPDPAHGTIRIVTGASVVLATSNAINNASSAWQKLQVKFTVPAGNATLEFRFMHGYPTAGVYDWDMAKVSLATGGADESTYFDGDTPDTAIYRYDWVGAAHNSLSTRTDISGIQRDPAAFDLLPGQSLWDFADPLVQAGKLRLFCDGLRVWHLVDPAKYAVPGLVSVNAGANAKEAADEVSRYGEWFDSVVIRYRWTDAAGVVQTRYDVAGEAPSKTITVEKDTPFPGVGAAAALVKRSASRGRVLALTAVSSFSVTPSMALQATLPETPLQRGVVSAVEWRLPDDDMTIRTRGGVDVASESWTYLAPGVTWLASPVGASWISEAV